MPDGLAPYGTLVSVQLAGPRGGLKPKLLGIRMSTWPLTWAFS